MTNCHDCRQHIPAGHAHARSISFKRVVLCRWCAVKRGWSVLARVS